MKPLILVTGFGAFPGAPVNPTEALVSRLEASSDTFDGICILQTAVFDVDYRSLPLRLETIASLLCPDIAIHFGLSAAATGFRLERVARNEIRANAPDNAGFIPDRAPDRANICEREEALASSLPLESIHDALSLQGLPVDYSDDAGGYLCNFLFYHARSGLCPGFAPAMAGFIHVPPLKALTTPQGLDMETLVAGASTIIETCTAHWQASS